MIMNYWLNLNERERWIVGVGSAATILYLLYAIIYSPITSAINSKNKMLIEKKQTLAWMQQVKKPGATKTVETINASKLLTIISSQVGSKPLEQFPHQLQQTSQGDIDLSFERVPYGLFLKWLWALESQYALTLKQLLIEHTSTDGVVKINLTIAAK